MSGLERLRRRMSGYRERTREQETVQEERDRMIGAFPKNTVVETQQMFNNSTVPPPLLGFPLSSPGPDSLLCWLCGSSLPTLASLNQHATDIHFTEWLSAYIEWEKEFSYRFLCPQCGHVFPDLGSFQIHVVRNHEEVLLSWLESNGFLGLN